MKTTKGGEKRTVRAQPHSCSALPRSRSLPAPPACTPSCPPRLAPPRVASPQPPPPLRRTTCRGSQMRVDEEHVDALLLPLLLPVPLLLAHLRPVLLALRLSLFLQRLLRLRLLHPLPSSTNNGAVMHARRGSRCTPAPLKACE
ncbi:hypothetical protein C8R45DRAFT_1102120 [Mycena sanguinolenta]|nr:hypothetical protein C8R45DRAFT_1102120 [Mycena sanguinolenta]